MLVFSQLSVPFRQVDRALVVLAPHGPGRDDSGLPPPVVGPLFGHPRCSDYRGLPQTARERLGGQ